jgi:hypothetical protein
MAGERLDMVAENGLGAVAAPARRTRAQADLGRLVAAQVNGPASGGGE